MRREELLRLQAALVERLCRAAGGGEALRGIDAGRLDLVAALTHAKRVDKIRSQLPATFAALGERAGELALRFAARHPPLDAHSVANALQFFRFLARERDCPPFLPDVCYCEVAMACLGARAAADARTVSTPVRGAVEIRRRPGARLRRCEYDIRPLLAAQRLEIEKRTVFLVVCRPPGSPFGKVFEIGEGMFEVLSELGRWHVLEPDDEWLADESTLASLRRFCELGILEMREAATRCASA